MGAILASAKKRAVALRDLIWIKADFPRVCPKIAGNIGWPRKLVEFAGFQIFQVNLRYSQQMGDFIDLKAAFKARSIKLSPDLGKLSS